MERLQSLLRQYNLSHKEDFAIAPWSKQYCEETFPKYWEIVYSILQPLDKSSKVLEIGCGLGDITAILCHLGFKHVASFEKDKQISSAAQRRIAEMFDRNDVVQNENYPNNKQYAVDILILVNCAYADMARTKQEYQDLMREYYVCAGCPRYFLMEVIGKISSWETYKYPTNRKSKTLYLIER